MDFNEVWANTASSVSLSCRNGDVESLQRLLEMKKPVDRMDNRGYRPIHEAAQNNRIACLKLLLQNGNTDLNWRTHEEETALVIATKCGHEEMVKLLLDAKADPNSRTHLNEAPLHFATDKNMLKTINNLIEAGCDINAADYGNETSLHMAVQRDYYAIVCTLISNKANVLLKDDFGRNAVFMAAESGRYKILKYLLNHLQTINLLLLIDTETLDGTTPVMIAAQNGHFACLQLLIDNGADANKYVMSNNSAIDLAIDQGRFECFQVLYFLLEERHILKCCTKNKQCLLHILVNARRYESKIFNFLIINGHQLDWCTIEIGHNDTAINRADYFKMCSCYYDCGPLFDCTLTVLTSALLANNYNCISDIVEHGEGLNEPYQTLPINFPHPLDFCSPEIAEKLLINGANPNYPLNIKKNGCPFVMQMTFQNPKLLIKLIKYGGDILNCFFKCAKGTKMICVGNKPAHKCLNKIIKCFLGPTYCLVSLRDGELFYVKLFLKEIPDIKELECNSLDKTSCVDINFDSMSLRHLCRKVIVRKVLESTQWSVLKDSLQKLQLPVHIINYLLYEDL